MLETEADRLESIKALGGQIVRTADGASFWALFDEPGTQLAFEDNHVNSTAPRLTARTSDVKALGLDGVRQSVTVGDAVFVVREHLPGDAPGWSLLILGKP